jgi:UDP-N-acetylglucosamine acyltransferase
MIDSRAIVAPSAKIANDVIVGPWTIIGENVEIGAGTWIGPHVIIKENVKIGQNNKIYQFASIGEDPQHLNYKKEVTWLEIGDNNTIREFCTISRGTAQGGGITRIGNQNFIMAYVHIAHDCQVGNQTIFVNNASLSGHVRVHDYVTIGGFVGVHQFCTIGAYSFVSFAAMISKDVLPYVMAVGNSPKVAGLNAVGLKRRGFTSKTIRGLRQAYSIIYRQNLTVKQALVELQGIVTEHPEVQLFIEGLQSSARGVIR